MEKNSFVK